MLRIYPVPAATVARGYQNALCEFLRENSRGRARERCAHWPSLSDLTKLHGQLVVEGFTHALHFVLYSLHLVPTLASDHSSDAFETVNIIAVPPGMNFNEPASIIEREKRLRSVLS